MPDALLGAARGACGAAGSLAHAAVDPSPRHTGREAQATAAMPASEDQGAPTEDETTARLDALDPDVRRSLELGPPAFGPLVAPPAVQSAFPMDAPRPPTPGASPPRGTLDELLPALVRKIAWSGDGHRGSVRMELGAGALSGGTVVVHADQGRVRVEVSAPAGADPEEWQKRIDASLRARGLDVEHVEVS